MEIAELKRIASQLRRDSLRMVHAVNSGHPGAALGCADLFTALYFDAMDHKPSFNMDGANEDVFFLSNGHLSAIFYSALARAGYFEAKELSTFRKINSRLQGHPTTHEGLPGVRIASGSLGQGLSVSIGVALAKKMNNDNKLVYCLMGDGESQEGQVWEAILFAGGKKVDNLIAIVDYNGQQIDGAVNKVLPMGNFKAKYEAFDWDVIEMNGNVMEDVVKGLKEAKSRTGKGKPVCIMMKTDMGFPIDFMVGSHKWHGVAPNDEQLANALGQLEETLGDY